MWFWLSSGLGRTVDTGICCDTRRVDDLKRVCGDGKEVRGLRLEQLGVKSESVVVSGVLYS